MTSEPHPLMQRFLADARKVIHEESEATDGFARAFLDATGLEADQAEMVVATEQSVDTAGNRTLVRKIWFQKRGI